MSHLVAQLANDDVTYCQVFPAFISHLLTLNYVLVHISIIGKYPMYVSAPPYLEMFQLNNYNYKKGPIPLCWVSDLDALISL